MDWNAELATTNTALTALRSAQPNTGKAFTGLHQATMGDGALTVHNKELIALAIGIATRCTDCIGFHLRAAMKAGASRDEIAETVSVAVMMGGGPALMYGAKALDAFDQMA